MAMTYSTLVADKSVTGSIANWVNYALLPADDVLTDAQAFVYSRLRTREMRTSSTISLALDDLYTALPARFVSAIGLFDQDGEEIKLIDERSLLRRRSKDSSGAVLQDRIRQYAVYDERLNFDAKNDAAQTLDFLFYQRPQPLAATTNESNWLTDRYPHILRTACVAYAFKFRMDEARFSSRIQEAAAYIDAANVEADEARMTADFPVENR